MIVLNAMLMLPSVSVSQSIAATVAFGRDEGNPSLPIHAPERTNTTTSAIDASSMNRLLGEREWQDR